MRTITFVSGALALKLMAAVLSAAPTVSGPAGLGLLQLDPPEPFFEHIRTNNRLNLRVYTTNGTGRSLTFQQGSAVFRDAAGAVLRTSPISVEEFARRSKLVKADGFAGGVELTDIGNYTRQRIVSAVLDRLNRIVAVGTGRNGSGGTDTILARYNTNGILDSSFEGNGLLGAGAGVAAAVAVNAQSQVFVAGTLSAGNGYFLRAYDTNGEDLWLQQPAHIFSGISIAAAVAIDSQGRIVVGGSTFTNGGLRFFLARYLTNGSLDAAFGSAGITIPDFRTAVHEALNALAIDSADRIVAAGWATVGGQTQFVLSRHQASNGTLDTTFNTDGRVLTTFPGYDTAVALALKISPSGRILAGGDVRNDSGHRMALARYDTNGALDLNFSTDGRVVINTATDNEHINDIELDVIGRIVVTGRAWNEEGEKLAVVRLNGIGQLDTALAGTGILLAEGPEDWVSASARSVMVLPGDDIVVAGYAESDKDSTDTRFALARFRPSGSSVVLPINASHRLDLLDFPFYVGLEGEDFNTQLLGFDSKRTPTRLDLTLQFLEYAEPFRIDGIPLSVYEQNPQSFRLPLGPVPAPALDWTAGASRIFGTLHGGSRSQRFAYDFGIPDDVDPNCDLGPLNGLYEGLPHPDYDPNATYTPRDFSECYYAYGETVFAVASGTVVCVQTNSLDNFPVGGNHQDGNSVTIEHAPREFLSYAHLARGSVRVNRGDPVQAGEPIGQLGNAGQSGSPHLHIHYTRLDDSQEEVFCGDEGDNSTIGRPTYFNNVLFPSTAGGPSVRQLRSAIPPGVPFTVNTNRIPNILGLLYGPGAVIEPGTHDTLADPMRLRPPVTVQGSVSRAIGTDVADAGDIIEDVYRFTVSQSGTVSAQLNWNNGADLDMILYDQNLQPIQPAAAKTLAKPELLCAALPAGTYYLFVTLYDPAPGPSSASYQLDLGFYSSPRDIYVDKGSTCQMPFGNMSCNANWGGPYPTVNQGIDAVCPASRMFIRAGTYAESVLFRAPVVVRSYDGTAIINP